MYGRSRVTERREERKGQGRQRRSSQEVERTGEAGASEARKKGLAPGDCPSATGPPFSYSPGDQTLPGHFHTLRVAQGADFTYAVSGPESLKERIQVVVLL